MDEAEAPAYGPPAEVMKRGTQEGLSRSNPDFLGLIAAGFLQLKKATGYETMTASNSVFS